jgi:5-formyltetrahydrofolate cyclo-ligase
MTQNNSTGVSLGMGKGWYDKFVLAILQCLYSLVYILRVLSFDAKIKQQYIE